MDDGGNGSGVGVIVALVAPGDREVDDGVQHGETETMVRRRVRIRPGAAARDDRRSSGRRLAPVVDEFVVWLREKNRDRVREVQRVAGEREGPKGRGPAHRGDRNRRKCGGGRADSGDKIRRPGGALGVRVRGKWVRGRRGFYRRPELDV